MESDVSKDQFRGIDVGTLKIKKFGLWAAGGLVFCFWVKIFLTEFESLKHSGKQANTVRVEQV